MSRSRADQRDKKELIDLLLSSLDYGKKKQDSALLDNLRQRFDLPSGVELRQFLIHNVDFTTLVTETLYMVQPFSKMLQAIYTFLADYNTTILKAKQLSLDLRIAQKHLRFNLSSFRKFSEQILQELNQSILVMNPEAFNEVALSLELLIRDCHRCASTASALRAYGEIRGRLCGEVRNAVTQARNLLEEYRPRLRHETDPYSRYVDTAGNEYRVDTYEYHLGICEKTLSNPLFRGLDPLDPAGVPKRVQHLRATLEKMRALIESCFRTAIRKRLVRRTIEFLELPFWKYRWRIYELWILFSLLGLGKSWAPSLNLENGTLRIWYGHAREPVAWLTGQQGACSEVWFQKYTKHRRDQKQGIEPDITLTKKHGEARRDFIILECKERYDFPFSSIKRLANHYSTGSTAELNCFVNYHQFRPPGYRRAVLHGKPNLFIDGLKPDSPTMSIVHDEVLRVLASYLGITAILLDTSGSMSGRNVESIVGAMFAGLGLAKLPSINFYSFSDTCRTLNYDEFMNLATNSEFCKGGTKLLGTVTEVLDGIPEISRLILISDLEVNLSELDELAELLTKMNLSMTIYSRPEWLDKEIEDHVRGMTTLKLLHVR